MGTKARRLRRGVPGERGWIPRGWAEIAGLLAAMVEGGDVQRRCALSVFVAHFRVPSVCDVFSLCGACAGGAAAAGAAASAGDGSVCFRAEGLRGLLPGEGLRLPCKTTASNTHGRDAGDHPYSSLSSGRAAGSSTIGGTSLAPSRHHQRALHVCRVDGGRVDGAAPAWRLLLDGRRVAVACIPAAHLHTRRHCCRP